MDPVATSFLSSCVNSTYSGNANDITAAISLRTAYCAGEMKAVETGTGTAGSGNGGGGATPGAGGELFFLLAFLTQLRILHLITSIANSLPDGILDVSS